MALGILADTMKDMPNEKNRHGCLGCLGLIAFCGLLALGLQMIPKSAEQKAEEARIDAANAAQRELEARDPLAGQESHICELAKNHVEAQLKAPSTADFEGCMWNSHTTYFGEGRYRTVSWVDAQNGFGAKIRTHYEYEGVVIITPSGNKTFQVTKFNYF